MRRRRAQKQKHICLLVGCIIFSAVFQWKCCAVVLAYSLTGIFYGDFHEACSIRITEGFHLVSSSLHAKEVSLEPLFTNQVGFAALKHSRAKAQLPSSPPSCTPTPPPFSLPSPQTTSHPHSTPPHPTQTHTHTRYPHLHSHPLVLEAFILSLILRLLFARICVNFSDCELFM